MVFLKSEWNTRVKIISQIYKKFRYIIEFSHEQYGSSKWNTLIIHEDIWEVMILYQYLGKATYL